MLLLNSFTLKKLIKSNAFFDLDFYCQMYNILTSEKKTILNEFIKKHSSTRMPNPNFDPVFYLNKYEDVANNKINPLIHFLKYGMKEGRLGHKFEIDVREALIKERLVSYCCFDAQFYIKKYNLDRYERLYPIEHFIKIGAVNLYKPNENFDVTWYKNQYADTKQLENSIDIINHYYNVGKNEGRRKTVPGNIYKNLDKAVVEFSLIEPIINSSEILRNKELLPIVNGKIKDNYTLFFKDIIGKYSPNEIKCIIIVPRFEVGGANKVALDIYSYMSSKFEENNILIIETEAVDISKVRQNVISFSELYNKDGEQIDLLKRIIFYLLPNLIFNINSLTAWNMQRLQGRLCIPKKSKIINAIFCNDFSQKGNSIGYIDTHLISILPNSDAIITDNKNIKKEIIDTFFLDNELSKKIFPVAFPVITTKNIIRNISNERKKVIWASRITTQKNPLILLQIAKMIPDVDFFIYGKVDSDYNNSFIKNLNPISNIFYMGEFKDFSQIPVNKHDLFLYTSLWDGLPNILLEAGASKIPIVSGINGGIGELINKTSGYPVSSCDNADEFVQRIIEALSEPEVALQKAENLYEYIKIAHSKTQFNNSMNEIFMEIS